MEGRARRGMARMVSGWSLLSLLEHPPSHLAILIRQWWVVEEVLSHTRTGLHVNA